MCYTNLHLLVWRFFSCFLTVKCNRIFGMAIAKPLQPLPYQGFPESWSLTDTTIPVNAFIFLQWSCVAKYWHTRPFIHIFVLFCAPPSLMFHPTPTCTHFLPIQSPAHIYSCTACIWNFGGNFPAIRPKSTYCVPIYMNACLVFLSAHTLASCRTHPHPSAPIYVYLHPPKP